jgi:hypothetical protein
MASLGKTILIVLILVALGGCTIHFKASEVELDAERQRVETNRTYELEKVVFFERKNSGS